MINFIIDGRGFVKANYIFYPVIRMLAANTTVYDYH